MPLVGDTIRLKVDFMDYDGAKIDPTDVTVTIYDGTTKKVVEGPTALGAEHHVATGSYFYDYTIPYGLSPLVYEFAGKYDGKPIIGRATITREWTR
jgi:hypothetical protein